MSSKYSIEQMNALANHMESMGFVVSTGDEGSFSIGQMSQLAKALKSSGFTPGDITKLGQCKNLADIRGIPYGTHELRQMKYIIDCDADPFIPNGMEVVEHHKGGQLEWNAEKILLYLSKLQRIGKYIEGNNLRKELEDMPVLNANVLDYLLAHPEFIPEEWKGKAVFFWGTIYHNSGGDLCVRYIRWNGSQWDWDDNRLDDGFYSDNSAVLRAN